jgi:ribosomal protein S27E
MINSVMRIECDECNDYGIIFFGDNNNFDCEPCDCVKGENYNV